jgi:hypothetical protein
MSQVEYTYPESLPEAVFGVPVSNLSDELKELRNKSVRFCQFDAGLCIVGLLLTAAAGRYAYCFWPCVVLLDYAVVGEECDFSTLVSMELYYFAH